MIPNRKMAANRSGVRWVAENAAIGAANARPVSTATGIASTTIGEVAAPNNTMTIVKTDEMSSRRAPNHRMLPSATSRGVIGVAYIAWKTRLQTRPAMIGKVASKDAACMHEATSSPGARKAMYGDASEGGIGPAAVDVPTDPESHRGQEQHGGQERAEDAGPERAPVGDEPVFEDAPDARRRIGDRRHQSTSDRPVSRRNTSSSVDRRTSTVSGWSPRAWAAATAASPSSA